ncbi:MAG: tetratricopeptide repeat protein [Microcoleaceae cyanobacterium MO_207.B10]|nr:tetratricopeptide repeat protein [Microcoleaceae cyanobacterium MO_207.B10]
MSNNQDETASLIKFANELKRVDRVEEAIVNFQAAVDINPECLLAWEGLVECYQKIIKIHPRKLENYRILGEILRKQGRYEAAIACYHQALEYAPKADWIYGLIGDTFRELKQLDEARQSYQKAIELNSKTIWLYIRLGSILREQENFDEAISYYQRAIELNPENSWVHIGLGETFKEQGDFDMAIAVYEDGLKVIPEDYWLHIKLGEVFQQVDRLFAAVTIYKKAVQLQPKNIAGYHNLALVEAKLGNIESALEIYQTAISLNQNNANIYVGFGNFYVNFWQDFQAALTNYERALDLDSKSVYAHLGKTKVLIELGRFEDAKKLCSNLIEQFPQEPNLWKCLGRIAQQQQEWDIALKIYKTAINNFPKNISFYISMGNLLIELAEFQEAKIVFDDVLDKAPNQPDGLCGLARILEQQQKWDLALIKWQEVIAQFPQYIPGYIHYSEILIKLEKFSEAEATLQKVSGYSSDVYLALGNLYFHQTKYELAIHHYQKVIESGKVFPAYFQLCRCFLIIGDLEKINQILDEFVSKKYIFNQHRMVEEIIEACQLAQNGNLQLAWNIYQSNIVAYQDFTIKNLSTNIHYNQFICILSILSITRSSLANHQDDLVTQLIDLVRKYQTIFEPQHISLSIISLYLGLYYKNNQKYHQAISYFQNSLSLNPENNFCLSLLKSTLNRQHNYLNQTLFASSNRKIVILIISCKKNLDKIQILREKLYQKINLPYCFVVGEPELTSEWQNQGDILYVKSPDNYESLPLKIFQALKCLHCCFDFQGVLKLDDDTWIQDIPRFLELIDWLETESTHDYLGNIRGYSIGRSWHFSKCESTSIDKTPYDLPFVARWCDGGSGYFLSAKSLQVLFENTIKYPGYFRGELYEDVLVAKILYLSGIKPYEFNLLKLGIIAANIQPNLQELDAEIYLKEGEKAAQKENLELAVNNFQKAIEIEPDQPLEVYKSLSHFLVEIERVEKAIAVLKSTIDRFPEDASIYLKLGNILVKKGETEAALKYYRQAININPNQPPRIYRALNIQAFRVLKLEELGLAYLPIPKCASTTLKYVFYSLKMHKEYSQPIENIHNFWSSRSHVFQNLQSLDDYFKFTIIRDPIKRFLSCYKNRVLHHKNLWLKSVRGKLENAGLKSEPNINYFVENLENYLKSSDAIVHHASPQSQYLGEDLSIYDLICPIENLENLQQIIFQKANVEIELPQLQTGGPKITLKDLTEKSLKKLIEFYAADYQLLEDFYSVDAIWKEYKTVNS